MRKGTNQPNMELEPKYWLSYPCEIPISYRSIETKSISTKYLTWEFLRAAKPSSISIATDRAQRKPQHQQPFEGMKTLKASKNWNRIIWNLKIVSNPLERETEGERVRDLGLERER